MSETEALEAQNPDNAPPAVGAESPSSALSPEDAAGALAAARQNAARYRTRLRDTEAERDGLRAQVDARDRLDAERVAGVVMASGSDLWTAGVDLADLRGDDGMLSADAVLDTARRVIEDRPHWAKQAQSIDSGVRESAPSPSSFGQQLKSRVSG